MKKILVIDDDVAMVRLYEMQLRRAGMLCYSYRNGASALADMEKIGPDLVILDFELPDMKGFDIIRSMREKPTLSATPIITVTGQGRAGLKNELIEAGAVEVYTKPFSPALLLKAVVAHLGA